MNSESSIVNRSAPAKANSYKELRIWQDSISLSKYVYHITNTFPAKESYGLTSQMRRAAVSVASNIAEGNRRQHTRDFIRFLRIALGSLGELETQAVIACEISMLDTAPLADILEQYDKIGRGIINLQRAVERRTADSPLTIHDSH